MIRMINKRNKSGIIRILEAFIAILLILGATVIVFSKFGQKNFESQNIVDIEKSIINQIANNVEFRDEIIIANENTQLSSKLSNFVAANIPNKYDFELRICELESICSSTTFHQTIYAQERVISSTIKEYNPKKIKLYVWPR